ncbi:uncharacterized protein L3040_000944 [Drepanopeziza brunnea f. sp. 'multigermtubi']|uniref:uncharacterized protein n=1 Tax=Drepanopeziza brunnea f. sp. 'multigermtubi' TaxID=698441 RepID=UPI002399773D|nr:hypothetical protein L3040_000944 [Drepanopeziza brunnea f. sp. 'multigermtubi']
MDQPKLGPRYVTFGLSSISSRLVSSRASRRCMLRDRSCAVRRVFRTSDMLSARFLFRADRVGISEVIHVGPFGTKVEDWSEKLMVQAAKEALFPVTSSELHLNPTAQSSAVDSQQVLRTRWSNQAESNGNGSSGNQAFTRRITTMLVSLLTYHALSSPCPGPGPGPGPGPASGEETRLAY